MEKVLNKVKIIQSYSFDALEKKVNEYINELMNNGGLVIDVRVQHRHDQRHYAVITMQYNYNNGFYVNN